MKNTLTILLLLPVITASFAAAELPDAPVPQTENTATIDRALDVLGGLGVSTIVGYSTGRPWIGLASGCGFAVAERAYDHAVHHDNSTANIQRGAIICGSSFAGYWLVKKMIASDRKRSAK